MWLLRSIWKDILWLKSLHPAGKITGLILGIAIIFGVWYPGTEWWFTPVSDRYVTRPHPRLETPIVYLGIGLIVYIAYVIDRDRTSRK